MLVARGRAPRDTEIDGNGAVVQLRSIPLVVAASGPARSSWCGTSPSCAAGNASC